MSQGRFVWYDLMTTDPVTSERFYKALFGWEVVAHGPAYRMISAGGNGMGGVITMAAADGVPNHWVAYITVPDVAAACEIVKAEGGKVIVPARPIPGTGEFAVFLDPHGASFAAIRLDNDAPMPPAAKGSNAISWAELHSPDPAASLRFYGAVFGWTSQGWDMGGGQMYYMVGDSHNGGIMQLSGSAPPHWILYASVVDAAATLASAVALGGTRLHGPAEMPGVGTFAVLRDPAGAAIAVMQSKPRE